MAVTVGEGFGRTYTKEVASETKTLLRKEKKIVTVVDGQRVTVIIRDSVVPEDPYLTLVRAAAFPYQVADKGMAKFPVPPISRSVKDALIKVEIS